MKNKLTLTEQEELFVKDCKLINLKYEYNEYYGAAEPPVRCGGSHLSGLTEPPHFIY